MAATARLCSCPHRGQIGPEGWAIKQRIQSSHMPPCHRHMVIATNLSSLFDLLHCSTPQTRAECCLELTAVSGYRMFLGPFGEKPTPPIGPVRPAWQIGPEGWAGGGLTWCAGVLPPRSVHHQTPGQHISRLCHMPQSRCQSLCGRQVRMPCATVSRRARQSPFPPTGQCSGGDQCAELAAPGTRVQHNLPQPTSKGQWREAPRAVCQVRPGFDGGGWFLFCVLNAPVTRRESVHTTTKERRTGSAATTGLDWPIGWLFG